MTAPAWMLLLPLIILGAAPVALMILATVPPSRGGRGGVKRNFNIAVLLTCAALVLAIASLFITPGTTLRQITPLLVLDDFARLFIGLITGASLFVALLAYDYFRDREGTHEEFFMLLLTATLGSAALAASNHFASFFLGLEILTVSLYGMIAYCREREVCIEAALKYLVLAATSAAFLLFGMALIYAESGVLDFARLPDALASPDGLRHVIILAGVGLIIVGFGFKLALVPFHMWTPDVYQGAPAPVSAFIATASKGAMFAVLLRFFMQVDVARHQALYLTFVALAMASMLFGSFLGLLQNNLKRLLAYSSIANLGYLLVAFLSRGEIQATASAFYLAAYFVTTLGAFGIVSLCSDGDDDADQLERYRGLFWRRPYVAAVFTAMLFSLAGIPMTAGFVGKFMVVLAGEQAAQWALLVVLVVSSTISIFYYLRVVVTLYLPEEGFVIYEKGISWQGTVLLACLAGLLIFLGVYPAPLLEFIRACVASVYLPAAS